MFDPDNIKPVYFDNMDAIFDEKGSMFLAMRKVQWVKSGSEPDASKAKYELRKYIVGADGEKPNKGMTFLTEEGPHELTKVLIQQGFGHTKDLLKELKKRDDFKDSVKDLFTDDDSATSEDGEYFDMRTELLKEDEDESDN
jgi:hypothetical protein